MSPDPLPPTVPSDPAGTVAEIFHLWVSLYRNPRRAPVLDAKRERLIRNAVTSHGADTVEAAIRGVGCSDWHMGRNPQRKRYTDIELVLRDAKHIEMFAGYWDDRSDDPDTATIDAYRASGEDW